MRYCMTFLLAVLMTAVAGCRPPSNPEAEAAALKAAKAWVLLIDEGRYAESWDASSSYFQNLVSKEEWTNQLRGVRGPLGKNLSRQVKARQYRTTLPGAPDGEYVIVQFQSSFEHKNAALEGVTPVREKDGTWRAMGYVVK